MAHTSKSKNKAQFKERKDSSQAGETPCKPLQKTKSSPPPSKSSESSFKTRRKKKSGETCGFCGKIGHLESKCWHKLTTLNEVMEEHKITLSKLSSTRKGHTLSSHALHKSTDS